MDLQLQGKKAVVTGGSRGIGLAVARQLAQEGCDVAFCARNLGPLEAAAREVAAATGRQVFPFQCNTVDPESIKQFIDGAAAKLGGIHILVNSAARPGGARGNMEVVDDAEILHDFEEKVVGYLRCARAAVPYMKQAGWGRIVNVSGGAGRDPGTNVSGGVRNIGVINLSKSMANHLGPFGINVMAVYPGMTVTEATHERWNEQARRESTTVEALAARQAEGTLIKHLVTADEVANLVTFLCSPLAVGLTGEAIAINGGGSPDVHA
jgi:NAD(P)-dependent dehydrogenase (short-subunit alcohol dehydrogenase family)